ncbi:hypothetical protein [uncultured Draconibacterium sp.]|uniref:hypothetical protein n=1 Tax=uncultured Draconibacterium sp. TaxID=1573823 RepID=UPI0029C632CA|nr:hypothetical protein [uncultured Draconibacterium sp.]
MRNTLKLLTFVFASFILPTQVIGQIETTIFKMDRTEDKNVVPFFTNRVIEVNQDNSYTFRNSTTLQTNTLYFCNYNYNNDSIELNLRAVNLSDKYPTDTLKHNIMYNIYEYNRLKKGIKNFYIVVGGYGKSFDKQIHEYMHRLKTNYGDSLFNKAAISVFAWGTEDKVYRYYNALRVSKRGAADFAIFQHMLDEFMADTEYWETHPKDITVSILFSSMANEMFRSYILERENQNIPLVKTYHNITFVGSVAPRNVFKEGKAFHNLGEMTDTVRLVVNSKDILLKMSSIAHLKNRIGNKGPKNPDELPDFVKVSNIKSLITKDDMKRMGHDYVLTNPVVQDALLEMAENNIARKKSD